MDKYKFDLRCHNIMEDLKARILEAANSYDSQTILDKAYGFLRELRRMDGSYCWIDEQFNRCFYHLSKEKDSILVAVYSSSHYESIYFIVNHTFVCYTNMMFNISDIETAYINFTKLCELHGLFTSISNVKDYDDYTIGENEDVDGLLSAMMSIIGETDFVDLSD